MKGSQHKPLAAYAPIQQVTDPQPVRATCFHPSGETYVVGSNSKALKICKYPDAETRQYLFNESHDSTCTNRAQYSEGRSLPPVEPEILFTCLHIHCGSVYCATFNQSGNLLATGSNDQIVHLIRYNKARHAPEGSEFKLAIHSGTVRDVCFLAQPAPPTDEWVRSPSQSTTADLLASAGAGDFEINVSDCNAMKCIHSFRGHESAVMSLHSSAASRNTFVSGSMDGTIRLWDLRCSGSVSVITTEQAKRSGPIIISVTNDKKSLKIEQSSPKDHNESLNMKKSDLGGDNLQQQQQVKSGRENMAPQKVGEETVPKARSSIKGTPVGCVRLDPSGRLLVSGHQDGSCMLFDIRAGKVIQLFQAHQGEIRTLNFSPKSYHLITGSYDRKVKLIDLQGHLADKLPSVDVAELGDKCIQTAWHPYDYNFVSTCADGSATLWTIHGCDDDDNDDC